MEEAVLFVVATPIGNMSDFSFRAVETLRSVDLILAEDTRTSSKLLNNYGISTPMESFHAHNEHKVLEKYAGMLKSGTRIALISDAGMPGVSDPGYLLVSKAAEESIPYTVIPGASAFLNALILSGFPTERFIYEGFIPHKKGRQTFIQNMLEENRTVVFYESPHRILKCLDQMLEILGEEREIAVVREITKKFEEVVRGSLKEVQETFKNKAIKGEFVVVVKGI